MTDQIKQKRFGKSKIATLCQLAIFGSAALTTSVSAQETNQVAPLAVLMQSATQVDNSVVKDLLNVSMQEEQVVASTVTSIEAIEINNTEDIDAGTGVAIQGENEGDITITNSGMLAGSVGIEADSEIGDVSVVNTGDIEAGTGISVVTSDWDKDRSTLNDTETAIRWTGGRQYALYDMEGNALYNDWGGREYGITYHTENYYVVSKLESDTSDATISIENSGNITFSEEAGIEARNQTGASITIDNSGDISVAADAEGDAKVGILADVSNTYNYNTDVVIGEEYVHTEEELIINEFDQLVEVVTEGVKRTKIEIDDKMADAGDITITNSGDLDLASVNGSIGIRAVGNGDTNIENSGHISVGQGFIARDEITGLRFDRTSAGIQLISEGGVNVENSGTIEIGNLSSGIEFRHASDYSPDKFIDGGDINIINSGDISGGLTQDEVANGESSELWENDQIKNKAHGIKIYAMGNNAPGNAFYSFYGDLIDSYNDYLKEVIPDITDDQLIYNYMGKLAEGTKEYNVNATNTGNIELADGGRGIDIVSLTGQTNAINNGTITVGDGATDMDNNFKHRSAGIYQNTISTGTGFADLYSLNDVDGIITTGDDAVGIMHQGGVTNSVVVNKGSISIGNGLVQEDYLPGGYFGGSEEPFDKLSRSYGIRSTASGQGKFTEVSNEGSITTGDLTVGVYAKSASYMAYISPYKLTGNIKQSGIVSNTGIIETGDNSSGIIHRGNRISTYNGGDITIGDNDLSNYTVDDYVQTHVWIKNNGKGITSYTSGAYGDNFQLPGSSYVLNNGTVTTGQNTTGIYAYASANSSHNVVIQMEDGVINTGDNSVGIAMLGESGYSYVSNDGTISTGDNSVGIHAESFGFLYTDWSTYPATKSAVPATVVIGNAGTIETGDNSVGVYVNTVGQITDTQYDWSTYPATKNYVDYDSVGIASFTNTGEIRVGANSTAIMMSGDTNFYQMQDGTPYLDENGQPIKMPNLINEGTISATQGIAISLNADNDLDSTIYNGGVISGDIIMGGGNNRLLHANSYDLEGNLTNNGLITLHNNMIDMGAGDNVIEINNAQINFYGGNNNIYNATVNATAATFNSVNNKVGDTLTIHGDISGDFQLAVDVSNTATDSMVVTGDIAQGTQVGVTLNAAEQLKGEVSWNLTSTSNTTGGAAVLSTDASTGDAIITIEGENGIETITLDGLTGDFGDTVQKAELVLDEATGEWVLNATFGLSHFGTAAISSNIVMQDWWSQSINNTKHGVASVANAQEGFSGWAAVFNQEGTVTPNSSIQDLSFDERLSGMQAGLLWTKKFGESALNVNPFVAVGKGRALMNANDSSVDSDMTAYGITFNYQHAQGLFVDAGYQKVNSDNKVKVALVAEAPRGETDGEATGYTAGIGYNFKTESGLVVAPQAHYQSIESSLDNFMSSDELHDVSNIEGEMTRLTAGFTVSKTFNTDSGIVTPSLAINYLDVTDGFSSLITNDVDFDADVIGSGYQAEFGLQGTMNNWQFGTALSVSKTDVYEQAISTSFNVQYSW
ncbi:hypothetical protein LP316_02140 [Thalassotalea sp. LPB0316]|uniref:hypothetical protein n=1 Tax=Thalassotalea sp. LPB0316 TaxID=2769490 RepID=UPI0018679941|nr:hypothetical protein [Thalassotalea sp. LPB0316]QOL26132.1 hypothetical protein LP316_02140 [Thalassotalea sp. LPB0316]